MKNQLNKALVCFMILCGIIFMSCTPASSGSDSSENKNKAKYTVMIYGAGGVNLDPLLAGDMEHIEQFFKANDVKNINVTAQVNLSSPFKTLNENGEPVSIDYQEDPKTKGTIRSYMTNSGFVRDPNYTDLKVLHDPDVLTDFIKYSAKNFPAEKYILIFWNHGYCFDIRDQPVDSVVTHANADSVSRGVIYDNNGGNVQTPLSVFGIEEGIRNSGVKMELTYFYSCLVGQLETLYQIKDVTKYVISSGNMTYASNLGKFIEQLNDYESIIDAAKQYMLEVHSLWDSYGINTGSNFLDISLSDMSKWDNFVQKFVKVKDALIKKYFSTDLSTERKKELLELWRPAKYQITLGGFNEADIPEGWDKGKMYYYDFKVSQNTTEAKLIKLRYTDIDISSAFKTLSEGDDTLTALVAEMEAALNDLLISSKSTVRPEYLDTSSLGLMFITKAQFEKDIYEASSHTLGTAKYPSLKSTYPLLEWDKATHWSDFIKANVIDQ